MFHFCGSSSSPSETGSAPQTSVHAIGSIYSHPVNYNRTKLSVGKLRWQQHILSRFQAIQISQRFKTCSNYSP